MIFNKLFSCFGGRGDTMSDDATMVGSTTKNSTRDSIPYSKSLEVKKNCIFCDISPDKFNIILEDENFIVFSDIAPAARIHLLAIPRAHVFNVKSLHGEAGANLIDRLVKIGTKALDIVDLQNASQARMNGRSSISQAKETRYGFHIAPFNSVDHLHLHCLALPFNSAYHNLKYRISPGDTKANPPTNKGWGWFVTSDQASAILRKGEDVKVGPC